MKFKRFIFALMIFSILLPLNFLTNAVTANSFYKSNSMQSSEIVLGNFSTPLLDKDKNRVNNICIAARSINGYTLESGETFSFNKVVGKRKLKKGYKPANAIVNKKLKKFIGGGVCQLSSTLYNAAEISGLKVLERHSHSKNVSYIKQGKDATVLYNRLDLKFKNTKPYPVKIKTLVKNDKVYVWISKVQ